MVNKIESGSFLAPKQAKIKDLKKREQDLKNSTSNMESVRNKRTDFHKNELNKIETDIYYTSDEHEKKPQFLDSHNGVFEDQSRLYNCPKKAI